ncbi:MAG: recombinase family protein [Firmicutes bacterium]|nr:recombinase family protein [Bacillota bacterium]
MKKKTKDFSAKITALYVRRSVSDKDKDNNSLSIEAQKAECIRYVGEDSNYQIYCDDGKSGKDIAHRPAFQQMMSDAKDGIIERIVVKKYDRFSRNMREYLNITNELDNLGISVYSLTEPFNTATKEGRMMRNNLLNFAEFERETIAARVADAYNTKARETGFYQGGKVYYGYVPERRTVNGKTGSVLVPSEQAEAVKIAYELYQNNSTSLKDIIDYFKANNVNWCRPTKNRASGFTNIDRSHLSRILRNPLYVRADKEIYQYFSSLGYEMLDDISEYNGINGLYWHDNADGSKFIKLGYHEGLVDSNVWLAVQDKKSHNKRIPMNYKVTNSWLVGLTKCSHCGYSFFINAAWNVSHTKQWRFYLDSGYYRGNGCVKKRLSIRPSEVEEKVFEAMKERLEQLVIEKKENEKPDSKTESIKAEIIKADEEIKKLMEKLANADDVLFEYINNRVKELHTKKSELETALQSKVRKIKRVYTSPLEEPLSHWDELSMKEKHDVAATVIDVIYVSDEDGIDIHFSI